VSVRVRHLDLRGTHVDGQLCCRDGTRQIRSQVDDCIGDVVNLRREQRGKHGAEGHDVVRVGGEHRCDIRVFSRRCGDPHGWIEFTRMLYSPSSIAADFVSPTTPCLAAV